MRTFFRQVRPALVMMAIFTLLLGGVYPLVVTGFAQAGFSHRANGSLIEKSGKVVGSELLGQTFVAPGYFHSRPSAAGAGYDGMASSGSNLGPTNPVLIKAIGERVAAYRQDNGLGADVMVPIDAVTASASGLDPHISVANARLQAGRVARERGLTAAKVRSMISAATEKRPLTVLGDEGVNVLRLNLALDALRQ